MSSCSGHVLISQACYLNTGCSLELDPALETIDVNSRRAHRERAAEACERASMSMDIRESVSVVLCTSSLVIMSGSVTDLSFPEFCRRLLARPLAALETTEMQQRKVIQVIPNCLC